jgi:hypothetical protein
LAQITKGTRRGRTRFLGQFEHAGWNRAYTKSRQKQQQKRADELVYVYLTY